MEGGTICADFVNYDVDFGCVFDLESSALFDPEVVIEVVLADLDLDLLDHPLVLHHLDQSVLDVFRKPHELDHGEVVLDDKR